MYAYDDDVSDMMAVSWCLLARAPSAGFKW
jgi:hypothetical protein